MERAGTLMAVNWRRAGVIAGAAAALTVYVALAVFAALVFPPSAALFAAPLLVAIALKAPRLRAARKPLVLTLLFAGLFLLPLWPTYLNLKFGPLPILTPPRLLLYAATALWLYDMTVSPLRRGQLAAALRRGRLIVVPVAVLWALSLVSVPFATGKAMAGAEFFRQTAIWLLPFLVAATYVRRPREFRAAIVLVAIAAGVAGAIAIAEFATGRLLASLLSPFVSGDAEWLRVAQASKIRDGVFRAQGPHTHPLSLGEFLAFAAPIVLALAVSARKSGSRLAWALCLILVVGGALATSSRGAFLALAASLAVAGVIFAVRFLRSAAAWRRRPAAGLVMALALLASPALVVGAQSVITGRGGESAARSSQGRIDQIEQAIPKIMKRPIAGYGPGRAARVLGYWGLTLTIDNYYLSLALDLGLPGPLAFAGILIGMMSLALGRSQGRRRDIAAIHVGLAGGAAALLLMRSITSQAGNLGLLYVLLGAMAGAAVRAARRRRSAGAQFSAG
jgi:O-antigen ligase